MLGTAAWQVRAQMARAALRAQVGASKTAWPARVRCLHGSRVAREQQTAAADATPAAPADEAILDDGSPLPEFFAVERAPPMVYRRMSYLDPATRPSSRKEAVRDVPLSGHVFNTTPHQHAMHLAVVYYLDALRSGTASTKTRGEVAFSDRKVRPQKGTGRARLSDLGNPMLRKGGVAHGPRPRDFATDLPRKVRELALRSALSARLREGNLFVVPSLAWRPPPTTTGALARLLGTKQWRDTLFLSAPRRPVAPPASRRTEGRPSAGEPRYDAVQLRRHARYVRNFEIATRNLQDVELLELHKLPPHDKPRAEHVKKPGELNAYQVLQYPKVVMDIGALEWLEEKLGGAALHEIVQEEAHLVAGGMHAHPAEAVAEEAAAAEEAAEAGDASAEAAHASRSS